jgi:hypothetical protein
MNGNDEESHPAAEGASSHLNGAGTGSSHDNFDELCIGPQSIAYLEEMERMF